jgi:quercetin dioxygenase-like cupin family protein
MRILLLLLLSFVLSPPAQDPVAVNPKIASVDFENARVRIVHMRFTPHERLGLHSHPAQLVVRLTPSVLEVHDTGGTSREVKGPAESVFWEEATTHTVDNIGNAPVENVEIEFKNASAPSVAVPAPPLSHAKLSPDEVIPLNEEPNHRWKFQNQYVLVTGVTLAPGESTYFHTHAHDNISVEITPANIQRQLRGKEWQPPEELKPGEVQYHLGDKQPYTHRVKNAGKTTFRVIDIELLK